MKLVLTRFRDGDLVIKVPEEMIRDPRFRLGALVARGFGPEPGEEKGFVFEPGEWILGRDGTIEELRLLCQELGLEIKEEVEHEEAD
ncbi:MAG: hypothetical protein J7J22_02080 [Candidatus Verstraetearchaeota archaeon]|nr:hypothetical protein [Candidatus Verstraetearchaeota archaeon]